MFEQTYAEFGATIETEIKTHSEKVSAFEEELLEEQNDLKKNFDDRIKEFEDEYKDKFLQVETETEKFIEQSSLKLEELKSSYQNTIENYIVEVEGIVGALAERSISYGFQQIANEEKIAKDKWNKYTLWSFIALIIYTLAMVAVSFFYEFTWSTMALRGLTSIGVFGALIGFCSRQASTHAKVERHSRKMELELASLSPYFAGYEKEDLFEIKRELADRFFGTEDVINSGKRNEEIDNNQIEEILSILKEKK